MSLAPTPKSRYSASRGEADVGEATTSMPNNNSMASSSSNRGRGSRGSNSAAPSDDDEEEEYEKRCFGKCRSPAQFWNTLLDNFGGRFVAYLALIYLFVKGLAFQATSAAQLPLYKDALKVSAVNYQRFSNVANMGFSLKPLVGAVSDVVPILGYKKRYYAFGFSLFAGVAILMVQLLPRKPESGPAAAAFFFLVVWGVAALDLLCEGKYSELMVKRPKDASSIVTWAWGCFMFGTAVAACIEGPISDYVDVYVVLWITCPMLLIATVPSLLGWIPEGKVVDGKEQDYDPCAPPISVIGGNQKKETGTAEGGIDPDESQDDPSSSPSGTGTTNRSPSSGRCTPKGLKYWSHQQKSVVVCGLCNALAGISLAVITLVTDNEYIALVYIILVVFVLLVACYRFLPFAAFKANAFFVGHSILYLNIAGILDYWYTAKPACVADGPHFSYSYYQTFGGIMGAVSGFFGVMLFEAKLNGWSFRWIFFLTTALKIGASCFDLVMVMRWNEAIGIPDHAVFIMGDKIILPVVNMLDFMPGVMLMAKVCPKGVESTMYALLAGFSNFGFTVSTTFGYMLATALRIKHEEDEDGNPTCDFSNLPYLIVIAHVLLPLLIIPLAILLLPGVSMKKNVDPNGKDPAEGNAGGGVEGGVTVSLVGARESFGTSGTVAVCDVGDDPVGYGGTTASNVHRRSGRRTVPHHHDEDAAEELVSSRALSLAE